MIPSSCATGFCHEYLEYILRSLSKSMSALLENGRNCAACNTLIPAIEPYKWLGVLMGLGFLF